MPSAITNLGESAFAHCSSLEEFTIPSDVMTVGDGCFYGCSSLKNLTYLGTSELTESFLDSCGQYKISVSGEYPGDTFDGCKLSGGLSDGAIAGIVIAVIVVVVVVVVAVVLALRRRKGGKSSRRDSSRDNNNPDADSLHA